MQPSTPSAMRNTAALVALRAQVAAVHRARGPALAFDVCEIDELLVGHGLDGAGIHEVAARSPTLGDDAAATLFLAGIAARFSAQRGFTTLWAVTRLDLYAPGLEQVGLGPEQVLYAQGDKDSQVLAMAEEGLRSGSLACVVAEVKGADQTTTRRLQLAAFDGQTPMLLYRRHRVASRCPLEVPSSAMTRWRVGCLPSTPLPYPGVARARWSVELLRQRGGNPFSLEVEACDGTGRLALPAAAPDRAAASARAIHKAA